ncbi:MAG: methylmalonyl-CoA mutase family protein, partial [Saprospiraceae bacterium]
DWNYTFEPVSKEAWLRQIEADLKPRNINAIQSEWWPGEKIIFTQHSEDKQQIVRLPDSLFEFPPVLMEWIDTLSDEPKIINHQLLESLNNGVQSILFHIDPEKKMPFRLWLHGVFTDMIQTSVSLLQDSPEIINHIREIIPGNALIRLKRNVSSKSSSAFLEACSGAKEENLNGFRFVYEIPASGVWTTRVAEIFRIILSDLTYWISQGLNPIDFMESCILQFNPDTNYCKQIIQTRVLHMVWNNLWIEKTKANRTPSYAYLELHIEPNLSEEPNKYLIRASSSALAGSLTGIHALCIHHIQDADIPSYYSRIARNIHHLLNMESEMWKGTDPLAGSYLFDYYTIRWTQDIWSKICS